MKGVSSFGRELPKINKSSVSLASFDDHRRSRRLTVIAVAVVDTLQNHRRSMTFIHTPQGGYFLERAMLARRGEHQAKGRAVATRRATVTALIRV